MPTRRHQEEIDSEAPFRIARDGTPTPSWKAVFWVVGAAAVAGESWANIKSDSVAHTDALNAINQRLDRIDAKIDKILADQSRNRYGDISSARP